MKINIFWFRRDLRLDDNTALGKALEEGLPVLPIFIFDDEITSEFSPDDGRISFIYERISLINNVLLRSGSSLQVYKGSTETVLKKIIVSFDTNAVYANKDYEPYSIERDSKIESLLKKDQIGFFRFKDQVIFEAGEVLKPDGKPYTVFTPFSRRWLAEFRQIAPVARNEIRHFSENFCKISSRFPTLEEIGFRKSSLKVRPYDLSVIKEYNIYRDYPADDRTSYLSPHLRFGTVSIRSIVEMAINENQVFLSELIWREFFMQILFHFPNVVTGNFKPQYNGIEWRNNEDEFDRWCSGETGYPIVDAGMRQLNETGYMHNRVRMIVAGFLCKHLFTDWRWGEAYFADRLLDYELSSNNGNWQWAAGTGCDAAPYFRVFNPETQQMKFDKNNEYVKRWLPDFEKPGFPSKIVEHNFARERAITGYKNGIIKSLIKS
jgi:deoxyribodipyrimidine photo-lyase